MDFTWINCVHSVIIEVGNFIKEVWNWISKIIPTVDAIGISLITYYTFRLTVFPKN